MSTAYCMCFSLVPLSCASRRHSHTEIADRLFSLLKRLFDSDSTSRVQGVGSFQTLAIKIQEEFKTCPEDLVMEFNWANWNIEKWLSQMTPVDGKLFEGALARFSFDNVFRCVATNDKCPSSLPLSSASLPLILSHTPTQTSHIH